MRPLIDSSHRKSLRNDLLGIAAFIGVIWVVFLADIVLPLESFGLVPRHLRGLDGILTMPFLHKDLTHLLGNTLPLSVTLFLLAGSRANSGAIVACIILLSGALLWLFGREARHIGASGLVFGLIAFHVCSGFFEKRITSIMIAIAVGFFYSTTLLQGIMPFQKGISWDGHLAGALAGLAVALFVAKDLKHSSTTP